MSKFVAISEVAEINPRVPRALVQDTERKVSFVPMSGVSEEGRLAEAIEKPLGEVLRGYTYFEQGDIIFAKITPCMENGKAAHLVDLPQQIGFGSTEFHVLRPGPEVDGRYLFYLIWNPVFRFAAANKMTGAAGQQRVPTDFLKAYKIPLPPLDEQRRIAAILDKTDAVRCKRKVSIRLTEEFLRSTFLEMFGDPVTNPKGWRVCKINEICSEIVDCVNRTAQTVDYPTPFKMIRTTNVRNYSIDLTDARYVDEEAYNQWTRRLMPRRGDIVFTREAPAGEAGIIESDENVFLGQRTMHFRPDISKTTSEYLLFELMGCGIRRQIDVMSAGSTVKHLSVPECKEFQVRVPPFEMQKIFSAVVNSAKDARRKQNTALEKSEFLFASSVQLAFRGEL